MLRWALNSLVAATLHSLLALVIASMAAYALARMRFRGRNFIWPIFVLFSPDRLTLPAGLSSLQGAYAIDYPVIMAGATVASVPVLILYAFVQRYVIEGVATSGIKG